MILVCGTNLNKEDLPLSTELDYRTVPEEKTKTSLMMLARKTDVVSIYVRADLEPLTTPIGDAKEKVVLFNNDTELISLLSSKPKENVFVDDTVVPEDTMLTDTATTDDDIAEITTQLNADEGSVSNTDAPAPAVLEEPVVEMPTADSLAALESAANSVEGTDSAAETDTSATSTETKSAEESYGLPAKTKIPTVIEEFTETTGANIVDIVNNEMTEVDMWRRKVSSLEDVITQCRSCIQKVTQERDNVYDVAIQQLEEQRMEYEGKLVEAQSVIQNLKNEVEKATNIEPPGVLAQYNMYAETAKAILKEGLQMPIPTAGIVAAFAGSTESTTVLYQSLALFAVSGYNGYIIDLTGDTAFSMSLQNIAVKLKMASHNPPIDQLSPEELQSCSLDNSKDVINFLRHTTGFSECLNTNFGVSKVACAGFYNDIYLLSVQWKELLQALIEETQGAPIIFLMPPITSFVGRYLAAYLGTAIITVVGGICAPSALYSMRNNLYALPDKRVRLMALNYMKYPGTDALLGELNKRFAINRPAKANTIFSMTNPSQEDFRGNIANNNEIWGACFGQSV